MKQTGLEATRLKWERHWQSALKETDIDWLKNVARCNSIRLPIGYYTLGPRFCTRTPFEGQPAEVYVSAWNSVKKIIEDCYHHGIGVLLDLHALPGGANTDSHSGTDTGKAELWKVGHNLSLATECVAFLLREVSSHKMSNVIGIELCNEPSWGAASEVWKWYDQVLPLANEIDPSIPVYIGDCWNLPATLDYALKRNAFSAAATALPNPVIVDSHKYYTFSAKDHNQSPQQIIARVKDSLGVVSQKQGNIFGRKTAVAVYIGEYSCTLDTKTWNKVESSERPSLTRAFGNAQMEKWQKRTNGSAFWTFKMDWMDGGDWGFKAQVKTGSIFPPVGLTLTKSDIISKSERAQAQKNNLRDTALSQHAGHWKKTAPSKKFEHWRYENGWDLGFGDAMAFFCARVNGTIPDSHQETGGDKIGAFELWIRKRMVSTGQLSSSFGWEWEHGYRRGVRDFYQVVSI